MPHIALVNATEELGGVEIHTLALAQYLASRGHRVTVAVMGADFISPRIGNGPVRVVRASSSHNSHLTFRDAVRLFKSLQADVCVFQKAVFACGNVAFDIAARTVFDRYISIEHTEAEPLPALTRRRRFFGLVPGVGLWWYRLRLEAYGRSVGPEKIVCVSHSVAERLKSQYFFPSRKLLVSTNGIDLARFSPDPACGAAQRAQWSIPENALVFGAIGRLSAVKRYDLALRLFAEIARDQARSNPHLVLVGQGQEADRLRTLAGDLGLGDRVRFFPYSDAPWQVLNAFDVFVMPSRNEGLPFALMEAMACGRCAIAMRVGGIGELIPDAAHGWLVEPDDETGFLEAMRQACSATPAERARIGTAARQRIAARYDRTVQLEAIARVVENG